MQLNTRVSKRNKIFREEGGVAAALVPSNYFLFSLKVANFRNGVKIPVVVQVGAFAGSVLPEV